MTQGGWPPDVRWPAPAYRPPAYPPPRPPGVLRWVVLGAALLVGSGVIVLAVAGWLGRLQWGAQPIPTATRVASTVVAEPSPERTVAESNAPSVSARPTVSTGPTASATSSPVPTNTLTPPPTTRPVTPTPGALPGPRGVGVPDQRPGALPQPSTVAQAGRWLTNNAVYGRRVAVPTKCGLPLIDPRKISAAALERHLTRTAGCLTMVWRPALRAAGFAMPYPVVTVYTGALNSPCGRLDTYNAYYCSANQRIYFGRLLHRLLPDRDYAYELILAHEYGHAVQGRTGIFAAGFLYRYNASSTAKQNEYLRRMELQADCFAGTAMNALASTTGLNASDRRGFAEVLTAIADDTLTGTIQQHGSAKARTRWLAAGLATPAVNACRTFNAASANVR